MHAVHLRDLERSTKQKPGSTGVVGFPSRALTEVKALYEIPKSFIRSCIAGFPYCHRRDGIENRSAWTFTLISDSRFRLPRLDPVALFVTIVGPCYIFGFKVEDPASTALFLTFYVVSTLTARLSFGCTESLIDK